jgi:hypothetical protein
MAILWRYVLERIWLLIEFYAYWTRIKYFNIFWVASHLYSSSTKLCYYLSTDSNLLYFTSSTMCADLFDGHLSLLVVSYLGYSSTLLWLRSWLSFKLFFLLFVSVTEYPVQVFFFCYIQACVLFNAFFDWAIMWNESDRRWILILIYNSLFSSILC